MFDPQSSTYTYLHADAGTKEAVLIDPVFEQVKRDAALIRELGFGLLATLETQVHADHVTGARLLKQRLGSRIAVSQLSWAVLRKKTPKAIRVQGFCDLNANKNRECGDWIYLKRFTLDRLTQLCSAKISKRL